MYENKIPEPNHLQSSQKLSLKEHFTTVTPVSKFLAMTIFIAFPFLGFWVGLHYSNINEEFLLESSNHTNDISVTQVPIQEAEPSPTSGYEGSNIRNDEQSSDQTSDVLSNIVEASDYELRVSGPNAFLVINDKIVQTVAVDENERKFFTGPLFLIDLDVNFDGNVDLGVYVAMGSGGSNIFYEFYTYDSEVNRLKKISGLSDGEIGISNPSVNLEKKQVISHIRSGQNWFTNTYQFNGSGYDLVK